MSDQIITESEAKEILGVSNWREISKIKIMDFVNLIPNMDRETAIKAIEQFPEFVNLSKAIVSQLYMLTEKALEANNKSNAEVITNYQKILDDLSKLLDKDEVSFEEKQWIIEKEIEVADKVAILDTENKKWLTEVIKHKDQVIGGVLILGTLILGVKTGKFPRLKG